MGYHYKISFPKTRFFFKNFVYGIINHSYSFCTSSFISGSIEFPHSDLTNSNYQISGCNKNFTTKRAHVCQCLRLFKGQSREGSIDCSRSKLLKFDDLFSFQNEGRERLYYSLVKDPIRFNSTPKSRFTWDTSTVHIRYN
jgi:hypothetical protein